MGAFESALLRVPPIRLVLVQEIGKGGRAGEYLPASRAAYFYQRIRISEGKVDTYLGMALTRHKSEKSFEQDSKRSLQKQAETQFLLSIEEGCRG
jgi:hypothetical protein